MAAMNYISELNAFDNWIDTHPMSANAIGLWRALMQIANKAQWRESLAIPNALITLKSGLTTTSIKRAREELRQAGRITFDFRTGRQATIYHIIPFADQKAVQNGPQSNESETVAVQNGPQNEPQKNKADQKEVQPGPQDDVAVQVAVRVADQIGPQNGPIYKHKQNKTDNAAAAACAREGKPQGRDPGFGETAQLYQDNIHPFSGRIEAESLGDLYDRYGKAWVNEGIRTMAKSNGHSITYLERILDRWEREGYKSQQKGRKNNDFANGSSGPRSSDGSAGTGKVLPESIQAYADRKAARFFAELDRQEREKHVGKFPDDGRIHQATAGGVPDV
ncbi:DnaD domain protein [Acidaminococcus timonensis]|uniref:DnaD domain protein n=1 Tax=Acidaminococcus timonensis TaxID=1871002 RepID=UPI003078317B